MEKKAIEVYSEATNHAVIRMPGRRFPGSVIQGVSLSIMRNLAHSIHRRVTRVADDELTADAEELLSLLDERLMHYEKVLAKHGMELPYVKEM
jgi:hypothetical protein